MIDVRDWQEALEHAKEEDTPSVVVTADLAGHPDISFKGSVMAFDRDRLAWWEYARSEQWRDIQDNPFVAIQYRSATRKLWVRFYGEAMIYEEGPLREQVMAQTNPYELSKDPERKGAAVIVRVDRVRVGERTVQTREGTPSSWKGIGAA